MEREREGEWREERREWAAGGVIQVT